MQKPLLSLNILLIKEWKSDYSLCCCNVPDLFSNKQYICFHSTAEVSTQGLLLKFNRIILMKWNLIWGFPSIEGWLMFTVVYSKPVLFQYDDLRSVYRQCVQTCEGVIIYCAMELNCQPNPQNLLIWVIHTMRVLLLSLYYKCFQLFNSLFCYPFFFS